MTLELTEAQTLTQRTARDYVARVIAPRAAELDRSGGFPIESLKGLAELGLMAVNVPPELGGVRGADR